MSCCYFNRTYILVALSSLSSLVCRKMFLSVWQINLIAFSHMFTPFGIFCPLPVLKSLPQVCSQSIKPIYTTPYCPDRPRAPQTYYNQKRIHLSPRIPATTLTFEISVNQRPCCTQQNLTAQTRPFLSFRVSSYHTPSPGHATSFVSLESSVFSFFNFRSRNKDRFCLFVMFSLLPRCLALPFLPPLFTLTHPQVALHTTAKGLFLKSHCSCAENPSKVTRNFQEKYKCMPLGGGCTRPVAWCLPICSASSSLNTELPAQPASPLSPSH